MTVRHSLLAVGAVLVLGMTIYLVREVGRSPSEAQADRTVAPSAAPAPAPEAAPVRTTNKPAPRTATVDTPAKHVPDRAPVADVQPPEIARIAPTGPNPKLDAIMDEANRAYDQGDFEEAKQIAHKVLATTPNNVRMLRVVVSSECIAGDSAEAQKYFTQLPAADRAQMRTRCDRYGVDLKDP